MIEFTDDLMKKSLETFGENYKYPVYASINCETGIFARRYKTDVGFMALTDSGKIIIAEYSAFGILKKRFVFSEQQLEKLKIKKVALLPVYRIKAVFMADGKKFRLYMNIAMQVTNGNFAEQEENAVNLMEILEKWNMR